jgi:hypothetical protein
MARRPREDFAPSSFTARPTEREPIRTGPRTVLPRQFEISARVDSLHVVLDVLVEIPGFTRVTSLRIAPVSMTGSVTSSAMRHEVLIDQLVRLAVAELEESWEEAAEFPGGWRTASEGPGQFYIGSPYRRPLRGELLAEAARVYNQATANENPAPTLAVAAELQFQRSQASRLIRAARDAGLIPPVERRRGKPGRQTERRT